MSLRHTVAGLAFLPALVVPSGAQAATSPHRHEPVRGAAFDLQAHRGASG